MLHLMAKIDRSAFVSTSAELAFEQSLVEFDTNLFTYIVLFSNIFYTSNILASCNRSVILYMFGYEAEKKFKCIN